MCCYLSCVIVGVKHGKADNSLKSMQEDILELEFEPQSTKLMYSCPNSEPSLRQLKEAGRATHHELPVTLTEEVLNKGLVCCTPKSV